MKRAYLISILGTFLVGLLFIGSFLFGATSQEIISPKPNIEDPFDKIQVKLESKENDVKLFTKNNLIEEAQAQGPFSEASSYIVVDANSGEIIAEKASMQQLSIASLTKIMTAVVALDLVGPEEVLTISETAPKVVPTNMGLIPGQKWSLEELLNGILLTSSNDAAQVIKEGIDAKFGPGTFIRAMNAKAQFLGLKNTSFDNPQGYDGQTNFSSSADLATLSLYIYKNYPILSEIAQKEYQFFPETLSHKQADLYNWNGVLGVYPGVLGLKIGNTEKAQKTTIVSSQREGEKVLVVLLGAPGILERDLWASELLDLGFEKQFNLEKVNISEAQLKEKYASWKYF